MTNEKILMLLECYEKRIVESLPLSAPLPTRNQDAEHPSDRKRHLLWMLEEIPSLLQRDNREKAMRWFGFVQGGMWALGLRTIEDMKRDNMPSDATFDKARV